MKKAFNLGSILLLLLFLQSCTQEDDVLKENSSTVFRFSPQDLNGLPSQTNLVITVETPTGEPVLTDFPVEIKLSEGGYITEPLKLGHGDFVLTSFELVKENKLLYIAPESGAPTRKMVRQTLPLQFSTMGKERQEINVDILSAADAMMSSTLQLAVYVPRSGRLKLTKATAYIISGVDTLETHDLKAKTNRVPFTLDPAATYRLVIIKDGFTRASHDFIYNDLVGVWRINLDPAFTMLAYTHENYNTLFQFHMESHPGTITVDWGDGTFDMYSFTATEDLIYFEHDYPINGNHFITVTGDLNQIHYFYSFYGQGMIDKINFEQLAELTEIRLGLTRGPKVLNLSQNANLQSLRIPGIPELKNLILPANHTINTFDLSGPNDMNMPEVSGLINNIYNNVVNHNTMNGLLSVAGSWWGDPSEPQFVGPPSMAAKNQLIILRDTYGWEIEPLF